MPFDDIVIRVLRSADLEEALAEVFTGLRPHGLRRMARLASEENPTSWWPTDDPPPERLLEGVRQLSEQGAASPDGSGTLSLPLAGRQDILLLQLEPPLLDRLSAEGGADADWHRLTAALDAISAREAQVETLVAERAVLLRRAEESEALHTLGLAANRSLDPDEVLTLVARFSRSLLGGHYVTVTTYFDDKAETAASVGLRSSGGDAMDEFAGDVIRQGRVIVLTASETPGFVERYPLHAAEGMKVGLGVPLGLFGRTFGGLVVGFRRPRQIEARDTRLAFTLAGHAAVAIHNARLYRTIETRSAELERAYEELRWSSQAKERFFAAMSHELRTPLNGILGYHSLILDGIVGEVSPKVRELIGNADNATRSLLHLVNDILDLAKLEAGKLEVEIRPTDLRKVMAEALTTLQPLAEGRGLRLIPETGDPLPPVWTDAERVRQILLNLLSNAVKFTETGEVRIDARYHMRLAADGPQSHLDSKRPWVEITVLDTGSGIPAEDQERIFHEFEQVASAHVRGGTGLGLPISRKLARLLHGDLYVRSTPGSGSSFHLWLPADETRPRMEPEATLGG